MPRRCPARVCCAVATVGRLRPWGAVAVVRRCAGGVLQRGGPKGQQGCGAACVVSGRVSLRCLYSLGVLFRRFFVLDDSLVFSSVLLPLPNSTF